jgi:hypothetical protein
MMGVRCGGRGQSDRRLRMIGRFLAGVDAYLSAKAAIQRLGELAASARSTCTRSAPCVGRPGARYRRIDFGRGKINAT